MASKGNFEGTLQLVAPSTVTAGTLLFIDTALQRYVVLPMSSASTGDVFVGLVEGYVKDADLDTTCDATTGGVPLTWNTTNGGFKHLTAATNAQAFSVSKITVGTSTADVILVFPRSIA